MPEHRHQDQFLRVKEATLTLADPSSRATNEGDRFGLRSGIELHRYGDQGVGRDQIKELYSKHFIPKVPPDTKITTISRTIGSDRLVDELIVRFTHSVEMDWMLPGIPPTGKRVECATVAIVQFRNNKLYNEHIYWDQASVLVQLGLLDSSELPIAGVETARKLTDRSLPSNHLIKRASDFGKT